MMDYKTSPDKKTVTVRSPMLRTSLKYFIPMVSGMHYCKVLSPFKAMEWMYTDSLFEFNGLRINDDELASSKFQSRTV